MFGDVAVGGWWYLSIRQIFTDESYETTSSRESTDVVSLSVLTDCGVVAHCGCLIFRNQFRLLDTADVNLVCLEEIVQHVAFTEDTIGIPLHDDGFLLSLVIVRCLVLYFTIVIWWFTLTSCFAVSAEPVHVLFYDCYLLSRVCSTFLMVFAMAVAALETMCSSPYLVFTHFAYALLIVFVVVFSLPNFLVRIGVICFILVSALLTCPVVFILKVR